jgi:uncharacterized membrane protein
MSEKNKPDAPLGVVVPPVRQRLFDWLRERLVAGMLIALPIVATFIILEALINLIDSRVVPLIPPALRPETYLDYAVPGFGLLILLIFLTLLGAVATNFLGSYFVSLMDRILTRVPVVRSVYSVFKQIRDVFQSNSAGQYKEIVMVEYPKEGSWEEDVIRLEMTIEEGAKLILSGGLVYPEYPRPAAPAVSGR